MMTKARQKPRTRPEIERAVQKYREGHRSEGVEAVRQQRATKREDDFVGWINDLGASLRHLRRASGRSPEELAARMAAASLDMADLDLGFSDRVEIGAIKAFVDACDGTMEIVLRDQAGQAMSRPRLAGAKASHSADPNQRPTLEPPQIDALANLVVAKLVERVVAALTGAGSLQLKQEDIATQWLHEEGRPFRHGDQTGTEGTEQGSPQPITVTEADDQSSSDHD